MAKNSWRMLLWAVQAMTGVHAKCDVLEIEYCPSELQKCQIANNGSSQYNQYDDFEQTGLKIISINAGNN